MKTGQWLFALCAVFMLILFPLAAGCLSIPGPDSQKKTPTVTAAVTRSPQTTAPETTVVQRTVVTTVMTETTTMPPAIATTETGITRYAPATCSDQGGVVVLPGQQCPGVWLAATNTFSCCSVEPVALAGENRMLSAAPFTMTVNIDDNLGSILP
jgi:hypothetical protein